MANTTTRIHPITDTMTRMMTAMMPPDRLEPPVVLPGVCVSKALSIRDTTQYAIIIVIKLACMIAKDPFKIYPILDLSYCEE